jgi:hypothetical protein
MPRILSNCYPDGFFSTSGANKHGGEFLLNNADYSASSSPHWLRLYGLMGQDSIFTFGRGSSLKSFESREEDTPRFCRCRAEEANQ